MGQIKVSFCDFSLHAIGMVSSSLHLAKQNFKFSVAHFLIFDDQRAEKLHGHNYQVKVDLTYARQLSLNQTDFVDFNLFKKAIKAHLDAWDEHVLLPRLHPDMKCQISSDGKNYDVHFRDRFYSFPVNEVLWLDITNTSVESFSKLLATTFLNLFSQQTIRRVRVTVQETPGQAASSTASV